MQSALLAHFKQKCGEEIQLQMKQAIAKLLYTKREIMMDIKAGGTAAGSAGGRPDSGLQNDVSLAVSELSHRQKAMQDQQRQAEARLTQLEGTTDERVANLD